MSLLDLKNKLYKKDVPENLSGHDVSRYDPASPLAKAPENIPPEKDLWAEKKTGLSEKQKSVFKKSAWIVGGLMGVILLITIIFGIKSWLFNEGSSSISIFGPEQAKSGKLLTYEITYKNENHLAINNARVVLSYPENLKPDENPNFKEESATSGSFYLGKVKARSEGKIVFNVKAYSPKGALVYLRANLAYQPSGFSSQFEAKAQLGINVISTPIVLEIQAPQNIASGDNIDYLVSYRNDGQETLAGLKIKMEYPEEFSFSEAKPEASEGNNIWQTGSLDAGESGKIVVSGKLSGEMGKIKKAKVLMGVIEQNEFVSLNEESVETKIAASPFLIAQTVNGLDKLNVNAGDSLQFKITFKNNSASGLGSVIVTEKLDSSVLDYSTLDMPGGNFDSNEKLITWKASDIPKLANLGPGESSSISFSIKVKESIPISSANDKNFIISSVAKIDSPNVATPISMNKIVSSNELNLKLNSKFILEILGFYNDTDIANTGPVPPRVDQETTYTLRWRIINISNDLTNVRVAAILPTNAKMTGKIWPEDARITYNERDNSISWDAGNIPAGTGIISAPLQAAFQVKIKPFASQVGKEVGLIGESSITAKDAFTGESFEKKAGVKTTNLFEDKSLSGEGRVAN